MSCADAGDDSASAALAPSAVQRKSRRSKSFSGRMPWISCSRSCIVLTRLGPLRAVIDACNIAPCEYYVSEPQRPRRPPGRRPASRARARNFQPEERRVLALALQRLRLDPPVRGRGSKTQTSAVRPTARCPASTPEDRAGVAVTRASASAARTLSFGRPFQRQRQQQFEAGGAGLGFAERQLLVVVVDRRVVGAHGVDGAVGEARAQRGAVARAAQRRHQVAVRIELADVEVAQMQVMDADIAGDRQAVLPSRRGSSRRRPRWTGGRGARATPVSRTSARIVASAMVSADGRDRRRGRGAWRPRRRARRRRCARARSCGRSQTR